ncbi:MAG: T9SS type A sorting domain-containing protein [Ignavibacteria bacterium]|jgi:hypothetical protein
MKFYSNIKKTLFQIIQILVVINYCVSAQSLFIQNEIDNNFNGACSVCSYDLDGDGDLDVLAAGNSGNQIAWWESEYNNGINFTKYVIDANATGIIFVDGADVDSDNDIDILCASWQGNEVAIWKNVGGEPVNWEKEIIDANVTQAHEVHSAYVDADTLLDIIAASGGDNEIIWYRNTGGSSIVWEKNVVDNQFTGARSVVSFDINEDGYNDLIGAALSVNQISIWFNSGTNPVQWNKQVVDNTFGGAHWVQISDLDGDQDPDIIGAGAIPGSIAWWRNDGGDPIQWSKQTISNSFSGALSVDAADLDLDDDMDVFGAATNAYRVNWWENNGNTPIQWYTNSILNGYTGAWPVFGVDLDEDGDIDILTAADAGNRVTWLENTTITTSVIDKSSQVPNKFFLFQNYPNPFNPQTNINFSVPEISFVSLKVFDVLGNEIAVLINEEKQAGTYEVELNAIELTSGIYFYHFKAGNFSDTKKMVIMK